MGHQAKLSWVKIHQALHDGSETVLLNGKAVPIRESPTNGCRFVRYNDTDIGEVTFMEQNKRKASVYAQRARDGETLTWAIPKNPNVSWILIENPVKQRV